MDHPIIRKIKKLVLARLESAFVARSPTTVERIERNFPPKSSSGAKEASRRRDQFAFELTVRFALLAFLLATAIAYSVGMACRIALLHPLMHAHRPVIDDQGMSSSMQIERPATDGNGVPFPTFTTKQLQQEAAVSTRVDRYLERDSLNASSDDEEDSDDDDETGIDEEGSIAHHPSGQHLSVIIDHVDPDFLSSEERIERSMFELMKESGATQLSYSCHSLAASGTSCVGVRSEKHVFIYAWPKNGVVSVDIFTCATKPSTASILDAVEEVFAVPINNVVGEIDEERPEPRMLWSQRLRGFRGGFHPQEQDLGSDLLGGLSVKLPLLSEQTEFQRVDILEVIHPKARSSVTHDRPDKVLYLDGVQQSTLYGEAEYHEALVHPSMFSHPDPKRVAIIGGGEGATLREVLKHKTLQEVVMVEIDGELVEMCREHLPEWSNCTDIEGSDAESCFDDSRASVYFEDAFAWFMDRFADNEIEEEKKFDVIIMDALDPDKFVEIVGSLYKDDHFIDSLFNGLSEEGVFVVQLGEADTIQDPAHETGPAKDTAHMMEGLEKAGFKSMHVYDEGHSHFYAAWSYLVCFKNVKSRERWYRTPAEIEIELRNRLHGTKSGMDALRKFDAATMTGYQVPPKADEVVHCRKENTPRECEEYLGVRPDLGNPQKGIDGKPVFSPVFERHSKHVMADGEKEGTKSFVITRLSSMIEELVGKKAASGLV